jgi:putative chitinase
MSITADQLQACVTQASSDNIALYAQPLSDTFDKFDITTPVRMAAFIGQIVIESEYFRATREDMYYSNPAHILATFPTHFSGLNDAATYAKNPIALANRVYANRLGNGDEASGDGYNFRGGGLIQTTGRGAYQNLSTVLGIDLISNPDLISQPEYAALSAGVYWSDNSLNQYADNQDIKTITRKVNGPAMLALNDRTNIFNTAYTALTSN